MPFSCLSSFRFACSAGPFNVARQPACRAVLDKGDGRSKLKEASRGNSKIRSTQQQTDDVRIWTRPKHIYGKHMPYRCGVQVASIFVAAALNSSPHHHFLPSSTRHTHTHTHAAETHHAAGARASNARAEAPGPPPTPSPPCHLPCHRGGDSGRLATPPPSGSSRGHCRPCLPISPPSFGRSRSRRY